jgi:hypothetical protein
MIYEIMIDTIKNKKNPSPHTKLHTRPVATGVYFLTRFFFHNFLKNDAHDLKKMV